VYDGGTVWVVSEEATLEKRELQTVWGDDDTLYVRGGVAEGEQLVTSPLSAPVEGTRVEVVEGTE
jgi:multidrug efflux pump subunit AcrA (membrane-fusion protein)